MPKSLDVAWWAFYTAGVTNNINEGSAVFQCPVKS